VTAPRPDAAAAAPSVANPPGLAALRRRVATHATALERMRAALAGPGGSLALRALARHGTEDPAIGLLDTWAYVADVVAFYSERIAHEGYLRTATQRGSVRELARTLGYELRPGVAAQVDLAYFVQDGPGTPDAVLVPRGTPAQSVPRAAPIGAPPGPAELPQTFEITDDLEARAAWNVLPAVDSAPQDFGFGRDHIWLLGASTPVRAGDTILVVGDERIAYGAWPLPRPRPSETLDDDEKWDFRVVTLVDAGPDGNPGWVRLSLDRPIGFRRDRTLIAGTGVKVYAFATRGRLFGWNAPDPNLLVTDDHVPAGAEPDDHGYRWGGFEVASTSEPTVIELDGEHPEVLAGSWVVLEQPGHTEAYRVERVTPDGAQRYALSGPITRLRLDLADHLTSFDRRRASVHCGSGPLPAADEPASATVGGRSLVVAASEPPLPAGRRILVRGTDAGTEAVAVETATVATCTPSADGRTMTLTLTTDLVHAFRPGGLEVLANVAVATHGESVAQVLGSGDGRAAFATYRPRRSPLTYVRATTPDGARPEISVRVDGVEWSPVPSLADAGPTDRVYAVRHDEDGSSRIVLGDGVHGARPATGVENVTARYRVGIGGAGAVDAGQISLLPRRPMGVREVTNPAASQDWAPAEDLESARVTAPRLARTLDRAVSVTDHEDFARGYAGVGPARADLVWDGRVNRVVLTVLGAGASAPSADLLGDLERALTAARDPGGPLDVRTGTVMWFGIRVELVHDPAYERPAVLAAVETALADAYGPGRTAFAVPVVAAAVLVVVRATAGVVACTMPRLLNVAAPPLAPQRPVLPPDTDAVDLLAPLPARWDATAPQPDRIVPAQLAALAAGAVEIGEMTP
jgi:predicted phage baseplate assembly protein